MMLKIKKILVLILLLSILIPVFASSDNWYEGKTITSIEFEGLSNVKAKTADSVVSQYVGKAFDDEVFSQLDADLYSQSWMDWMIVDAIESDGGVKLVITVNENPMISEIYILGNDKIRANALLESQSLAKGGFYSTNNINANAKLIKDYYLSKGYVDATVDASINEKEDNTVIVNYTINEGRQYKVRSVLFEGISGL